MCYYNTRLWIFLEIFGGVGWIFFGYVSWILGQKFVDILAYPYTRPLARKEFLRLPPPPPHTNFKLTRVRSQKGGGRLSVSGGVLRASCKRARASGVR